MSKLTGVDPAHFQRELSWRKVRRISVLRLMFSFPITFANPWRHFFIYFNEKPTHVASRKEVLKKGRVEGRCGTLSEDPTTFVISVKMNESITESINYSLFVCLFVFVKEGHSRPSFMEHRREWQPLWMESTDRLYVHTIPPYVLLVVGGSHTKL